MNGWNIMVYDKTSEKENNGMVWKCPFVVAIRIRLKLHGL